MFIIEQSKPMFITQQSKPMFITQQSKPVFITEQSKPMFITCIWRFVGVKCGFDGRKYLYYWLHFVSPVKRHLRLSNPQLTPPTLQIQYCYLVTCEIFFDNGKSIIVNKTLHKTKDWATWILLRLRKVWRDQKGNQK
jgi:hypothetical protein